MGFSDEIKKEYEDSSYTNSSQKEAKSSVKNAFEKEKQEASKDGKPWVKVVDVRINEDNPRNGFFDLDWNDEFIESLLDSGVTGETQEEMVDLWFRSIIEEMIKEEGIDQPVNAGNVLNFLKED